VSDNAALFYADDGAICSTDPKWLQEALTVLTGLFARVGLKTNSTKTKVMICTPGPIRTHISQEAYKRKLSGEGESYRDRKRRAVTCPVCDKSLAEGSLRSHMRTQHGEDEAPLQCVEISTPQEYRFNYPLCHMPGSIVCPVAGCGYLPKSRSVLHRHFANRHPYDSLRIVEEGFLP